MKTPYAVKLDDAIVKEIKNYKQFCRRFNSQAHFIECAIDYFLIALKEENENKKQYLNTLTK